MSKLTYNTRLVFKDSTDKQNLLKMLESQRVAWNECSKVKFTIPKNSIVELHAAFYRKFRDSNPEIPAQVVISAEQSVLSTYRSIKSNKHKITEPPQKKCLSIRLDKRSYSHKNGIFSLISLDKRIKCKPFIYPKLKDLITNYKFCDPLLFERNGDIWIALTFEIPETLSKQTLALGIDLGCRINAATSEGNLYIDKRFNAQKRRLRHLKSRLKSKGTQSAKRHLKKLRRKEANKNKNFSHHLANRLIRDTKANVLVLENLKGLKVKKHFENKNRVSQVPIFQLKQILTYKAPFAEKTVIQVSPSYTSQIDSVSGKKDGVRKGRRYYSKSGLVYDSDVNAAVNIGRRSKLPVSQGNLLDGQAKVNSPIVGVSRLQAAIPLGSGH